MSVRIQPLAIASAPEGSKLILEGAQQKMGFIPNLYATFAHNPEVLKSYLALGDALSKSGLDPLEQQIVALTVSRENDCNYCVAAHSAISAMSKLDEKVIAQVRAGDALSNPKLEALRTFAKRIVSSKGWVDSSDLESFYGAGYTATQGLAVILGVTMKTLSNYVNHVAGTPLDQAFSPFAWKK